MESTKIYPEDYHSHDTPLDIFFESAAEAEKCVKYLNKKYGTEKRFFWKFKERIVEYETAAEYIAELEADIAEKEAKNELNK